ncbi:MAG: hypothetical protein ACYC6N_13145 [Pirellulaceae bacterium]
MSIEFPCSGCGQTLRVGDDAAGKRAKCPKCQSVVSIPSDSMFASSPSPQPADEERLTDLPFVGETTNPYTAPWPPKEELYPKPGASPFGDGQIRNVPVDLTSIMNYAVEIWKEHLGLLVGVTVVIMCIDWAVIIGTETMLGVLRRAGQREAVALMVALSTVGRIVLDTFLSIGYWQMTFKMARRQRVEFADLFNGGPLLLPTLGVYILFGLAVGAGALLCIVPGIVVLLLWWPCYFLVIDQKSTVMESFGVAREITANNVGTTVLLWLVSLGIGLLGLLACCVGVIVAGPLTAMLFSVAYLMMSGQIPLNRQID